jgi:hypothetical protein
MDNKDQVVKFVHEIDRLRADTLSHWEKVQVSIEAGRVDDAISLLNGYFYVKEQLEGTESRLSSLLRGYFSEK